MSIEYEIRVEEDLLCVVSSGMCEDLDQLKAYILTMHEAAQSSKVRRALVDERRLHYRLSTIDDYHSGRFLSELSPQPQKIAVVCRQQSWQDTRFWETVARNRGVQVRIFTDYAVAEEWVKD